ncbi:transcriptional regulator [Anaeromassilibacillus sp. An172]|uniref:helix-turn-helix domain-containing protein n=1 Tax=Anaeromassilibacillus sp. An172 TaxID=1965570 RepID=UPI000B39CDCA|nr:helix-turn-helix transcriptional regulator [Anaeromassilibacillus sp. An172]OUP79477.1 transcriptional regulator [Anaeromassilibacillus sp. An172]
MELETIGRNIKKYRIEKKLRQEDLAEKTDLSANYIGMVERGEKIPSLETFISILNALEISADMVLADVLKQGYVVKNSLFSEDMKKLSQEDRERIYLVIETLIKYSQK